MTTKIFFNTNRSKYMTERKRLKRLRSLKLKRKNMNKLKSLDRYRKSPKRYIEKLKAEGKLV